MFDFDPSIPSVGDVVRFLVLENFSYRKGKESIRGYKEEGHNLFECLVVSRVNNGEEVILRLHDDFHQTLNLKAGEKIILGETTAETTSDKGYTSTVRLI